jgi:hypothetical protein
MCEYYPYPGWYLGVMYVPYICTFNASENSVPVSAAFVAVVDTVVSLGDRAVPVALRLSLVGFVFVPTYTEGVVSHGGTFLSHGEAASG